MMWPPTISFVVPLPVATLDVRRTRNRSLRRSRIFSKGRKHLREWGLR